PPHPYTLSLHDALPIFIQVADRAVEREGFLDLAPVQLVGRDLLGRAARDGGAGGLHFREPVARDDERRGAQRTGQTKKSSAAPQDRKSTRLNSSHLGIS